jgi:hypothetical protein
MFYCGLNMVEKYEDNEKNVWQRRRIGKGASGFSWLAQIWQVVMVYYFPTFK